MFELWKDPKPSFHKFEKPIKDHSSSEAGATDASREAAPNEYATVGIKKESPERSVSLHLDGYTDQRPGWPLLLMASLPTQRALDARKMSVVQWAMSLPDRPSPEAHQSSSDSSPSKSESPLGRLYSSNGCQSVWSELLEEPRSPFESKSSDLTWFSYEVLSHATSQFCAGYAYDFPLELTSIYN